MTYDPNWVRDGEEALAWFVRMARYAVDEAWRRDPGQFHAPDEFHAMLEKHTTTLRRRFPWNTEDLRDAAQRLGPLSLEATAVDLLDVQDIAAAVGRHPVGVLDTTPQSSTKGGELRSLLDRAERAFPPHYDVTAAEEKEWSSAWRAVWAFLDSREAQPK